MAKKEKNENDDVVGDIDDAFEILDSLNPEATFLSESALSNVTEFIDTGNYALNSIISGSLYGGIPMGRLTGFVGPESCLDKDTYIQYSVYDINGKRINSKGGSIEMLYNRFHGNPTGKGGPEYKKNCIYYVPSVDEDNGIFSNRVLDVVFTGEKPCYKITANGYTLISTDDHKYLTPDGYKKLSDLKMGDMVMMHFRKCVSNKKNKTRRKTIYVKNHPIWKSKNVFCKKTNKNYLYRRGQLSHAYYEASLNNMEFSKYLELLNQNRNLEDLKFIPQGYHVHHRDGNFNNNKIENLQLLTPVEHGLIHAEDCSKNTKYIATEYPITSIEYVGNRKTYDIKCGYPNNNYIANKFVVHNCGKTLMVNKIMANAQKKGMHVVYFDTENALDKNTAERLGCDTSKIKHCPIEVTEECRNQIVKFLGSIVEKKLLGKVLIVIDSLGNLITRQEKTKIEEGSESPDMGQRAKALKSMMRAITHASAKSNCPIVFTNHIYDDPSQLHPTAIKKQAGGSGPLYMASVIVQLAKKTERADDTKNKDANPEMIGIAKGINGLTIRALTTKNRFIPPYLETEMYLNFKTGLNQKSGLLEIAEICKVLNKQGHRYDIDGELMYFKDFKDRDDLWENSIMPKLEEVLKKDFCFKNSTMVES